MAGKPLTYQASPTGPIPRQCHVQKALPCAFSHAGAERNACPPGNAKDLAMPDNPKVLNQSMRRGCRRVSGTAHAGTP